MHRRTIALRGGKMNVQSIVREMQCEVKSVARIMLILTVVGSKILRAIIQPGHRSLTIVVT